MHCVAIVAKADQRANIILHCFVSWYHNLLAKTFVVYVGPVLDTVCIEKEQGRFTKHLLGFEDFTHQER